MNFFAARQPILDRKKQLVGYELLFRDSLVNVFPDVNPDEATTRLIEGSQFNFGLAELTNNKPAFINFTLDTLSRGYATMMGTDEVVIEILETVQPGKRLLALVKDLKEKGYRIALDDYRHQNVWRHFFPYVDIIKIDFLTTSADEIKEILRVAKPYENISFLAEKIETHEHYQQAMDLGFEYFQGFFFSKPEMVQARALPPSELTIAELLYEASTSEMDLTKVTQIFERDVNLSYKLLRYSNSAMFNRRAEISTIRQALISLGIAEIKKFLSLLFTAQLSQDKPAELMRMSLTRARFAELLAEQHGDDENVTGRAFLTGMMSLLDAILDQDMSTVVERLPLAGEIKAALRDSEGLLADYVTLVKQYEHAQWKDARETTKKIGLDENKVPDAYHDAVQWAQEQMKAIS